MSEAAKHKLDEELEAFEAERADEEVDTDDLFEGEPEVEPQTLVEVQDVEVPDA